MFCFEVCGGDDVFDVKEVFDLAMIASAFSRTLPILGLMLMLLSSFLSKKNLRSITDFFAINFSTSLEAEKAFDFFATDCVGWDDGNDDAPVSECESIGDTSFGNGWSEGNVLFVHRNSYSE